MPISSEKLIRLRPFLFHLTAASNVARILRMRRLESTATMLRQAGRSDLAKTRRREHVQVKLKGETVELRDQAPLHAGNLALEQGWTFNDFVSHLNDRVFFWPGGARGPSPYGVRHYERYAAEKPSILRISTAALLAQNPTQPPLYCRYNSGSPRCSNGVKSPRTTRTFLSGDEADFGVGEIVEVTFIGDIQLPAELHVGHSPAGPWQIRR
jgi:hypothetical protein